MSNQARLKADLAIADLSTNGGELTDEQANKFIRKLIEQPTIIRALRVIEMSGPTRQINKLGFGSRILRAGVQGTALAEDAGDTGVGRSRPTSEQILLTTSEQIAEIRIPYDVMEDNIERGGIGAQTEVGGTAFSGGIRDTILALAAERVSLDLEELALLGDTGSGDTYLAQLDGFIKIGEDDGNISDHGGGAIDKTLFKGGLKTLPDQYVRNRSRMRHYVSIDQEVNYRDTLADRGTALGDSMIQGTTPVFGFGVPIGPVALMPEDKGMFTDPKNLIMGVQRNVMMEFDKEITTREYIIVITARVAFEIEEPDAVVVYNNIG